MNLKVLITALDTFLFEANIKTHRGPHIRDALDVKRWMVMVVFALTPCALMAIWNTGVQTFVYGSGNDALIHSYFTTPYFSFVKDHVGTILWLGAKAFIPVMIISYAVGGLWEGVFAVVRGHEISEGFLVSGLLFALILPSTIPYWMVAVGVSAGIVIGKELFGGTGMNILNPALLCRCFLFFAFPTKMSGDVWVGTNPTQIAKSLQNIDGVTQVSCLGVFNIPADIKRAQVDAIAYNMGHKVKTLPMLKQQFAQWSQNHEGILGALTPEALKGFVTAPFAQGGLNLAPDLYSQALDFAHLKFGTPLWSNLHFFFGDMIGSMGETSTFACLLGALLLIVTGIGSWRTMVSIVIGAFLTAWCFELGSSFFGNAAWNPAKLDFPAYKHLLLGGLAFGLVFMATDPVTSPGLNSGKWIYGLVIGAFVIVIRCINPAFPEGVMLAILFGNVLAPLIDRGSLKRLRRRAHVRAK